VSLLAVVLVAVAAQRLLELVWAKRNEAWLKAHGGVEAGAGHYPLFVLLHAAWLVAIWLRAPAESMVSWPLLIVFVLLQAARIWVIWSLGRYWTTRVITVADAPLVRRGPYRWVRHPNYLVVVAEIAVLPLAFGAWDVALAFSLLNGLLLAYRIRVEDRALAPRRAANGNDSQKS
jgi:methyltransferase